ncbi:hypothetical protein [Streptomyces sp. 11x1]|uniref:hypothetical protein n=1 Tax=Streptomyces sp. 11x1 TaxID=3038642 RepID=UPI00292E4E49|nr:hypothetical protein [Streptomyces sp. 11x1]WNZ09149.1 hypothetical protein P8T65_17225 [Streptomyces sp. 11x1]
MKGNDPLCAAGLPCAVHGRAPDAAPIRENEVRDRWPSAEGTLWTAYSTVWTTCVLRESGPDGRELRRLTLPRGPGARLTAFLLLPEAFVLVWEPGNGRDFGQVERVGTDGSLLWSTVLPRETGDGAVVQPDWRRMTLMRRTAPLTLSGDRVTLQYRDGHRTGVAVLYCLDVVTGAFLWARRPQAEPQRSRGPATS